VEGYILEIVILHVSGCVGKRFVIVMETCPN